VVTLIGHANPVGTSPDETPALLAPATMHGMISERFHSSGLGAP
jgi:hypothetical protein